MQLSRIVVIGCFAIAALTVVFLTEFLTFNPCSTSIPAQLQFLALRSGSDLEKWAGDAQKRAFEAEGMIRKEEEGRRRRASSTASPKVYKSQCKSASKTALVLFKDPLPTGVTLVKDQKLPVPTIAKPSLHADVLAGLKKHHDPFYQKLGAGDAGSLVSMGHDVAHSRVARFENVLVNNQGFIVDADSCSVVKHSACKLEGAFAFPAEAVPSYDRVTTIAIKWGGEVWHFPMEALVGLAALDGEVETLLHVSKPSNFVLQWLALIGISPERVVEGTIHARELFAPEVGKCGTPTPNQIQWLVTKLRESGVGQERDTPKTVLLVKRTKSRQLKNFDKVEAAVRAHALAHGFEVYVHDDSRLPPVRDQLNMFANAVLVVAPHGAGLVNLIASPAGTTVLEFIDTGSVNVCYTRLSTWMGHTYHGVPMRSSLVDLAALDRVLDALVLPGG